MTLVLQRQGGREDARVKMQLAPIRASHGAQTPDAFGAEVPIEPCLVHGAGAERDV